MSEEHAHRWVAVGSSPAGDGAEVGRAVARRALAGPEPAVLIAFASDDLDLEAFAAAVCEESGDVPLVGCSTAGEISTGGTSDGGAVVVGLGGPGFSVRTSVARNVSGDLRQAGVAAATAALPEDRGHRALLLLSDGLAGDQQEIVRGAYSVAGAFVPLVGGCAGDELRMQRTRQIYGREVLTDGVVAVGLSSDAPIGIGVNHGWRKVGEPMLVTAAAGTRVLSLDGRRALDVYRERLGVPAEISADAFTAFALTHPLGLDRRGGEEVRFVAGAGFDDGSLQCIAEVPTGALVHLMEGDAASVLGATEAAGAAALAALGHAAPRGVLAFDCIARRAVLGDAGIAAEVDALRSLAAGAPVAGFYTYGEIARTSGMRGFHNQTLVVLAIA